jgi:hypothetical protein
MDGYHGIKGLGADSLLPDVLAMYKKWYNDGNPFIQVDDEKKGTVYVKVDGNRRITMKKYDDVFVRLIIQTCWLKSN